MSVEATSGARPGAGERDGSPPKKRGRRPAVAPHPVSPAIPQTTAQHQIADLQATVVALREDLHATQSRLCMLEARHSAVPSEEAPAPTATPPPAPPRERRGLARLFGGRPRAEHQVARRIIRLMAAALMTRAELAERSGVPLETVARILDQREAPDDRTLLAIADALGVDEAALLSD